MNTQHSGNWGWRLVRVVLMLFGLAVAARAIYDLLVPLVPLAIALLLLGAVYLAVVQHRRP